MLEQSGINNATAQPNSPQRLKSELNFFDESELDQHLGEDDVMITTLKVTIFINHPYRIIYFF